VGADLDSLDSCGITDYHFNRAWNPKHATNSRRDRGNEMTITYSLWDGAQLLGAGLTANNAEEVNKVVEDLQKVSINVMAHMRKVTM